MTEGRELCLAVDQGGTKMLIGAVDSCGNILASKRYPTGISKQQSMADTIMKGMEDFVSGLKLKGRKLVTVGMGVVGQVDPQSGMWNLMYNQRGDVPIPLAAMVKSKFGLPCFIDNDVKAATAAEKTFGIGRECDNFIYINIGTGIAAGFVCDGRIIRGYQNDAGEVGHMTADAASELVCHCGKKGCVEVIASGRGMQRRCKSLCGVYPQSSLAELAKTKEIDVEQILRSADEGDEMAIHIVNDAVDAVAVLAGNLINTFNPQQISLGGGVFSGDWLWRRVWERLADRERASVERVKLSELDAGTIGLVGASVLGFEGFEKHSFKEV